MTDVQTMVEAVQSQLPKIQLPDPKEQECLTRWADSIPKLISLEQVRATSDVPLISRFSQEFGKELLLTTSAIKRIHDASIYPYEIMGVLARQDALAANYDGYTKAMIGSRFEYYSIVSNFFNLYELEWRHRDRKNRSRLEEVSQLVNNLVGQTFEAHRSRLPFIFAKFAYPEAQCL